MRSCAGCCESGRSFGGLSCKPSLLLLWLLLLLLLLLFLLLLFHCGREQVKGSDRVARLLGVCMHRQRVWMAGLRFA